MISTMVDRCTGDRHEVDVEVVFHVGKFVGWESEEMFYNPGEWYLYLDTVEEREAKRALEIKRERPPAPQKPLDDDLESVPGRYNLPDGEKWSEIDSIT